MNDLKYTITKFDEQLKILDVVFEDNSWAQIRLINPLPKNKEELETIIRDFAEPIEAIQARQTPDADLSYIAPIVGSQQITNRKSISPIAAPQPVDPDVEASAAMWEQISFKRQIGDVLVQFGLLNSNPVDIPVSTQ